MILPCLVVAVFLALHPPEMTCQPNEPDRFAELIRTVQEQVSAARSGRYVIPTEDDYRSWRDIIRLFRMRKLDSCGQMLSRYDYALSQVRDGLTGNVYDVIQEKAPIRYGWGTFVFNPHSSKRLFIHVNHPVDDADALTIGGELFRRLNAEWLLVAGTSRYAVRGKVLADAGRARQSIFEQWHEMLTDLTRISLSIHGYRESAYNYPIRMTDLIVGNGKTSDDQWGISQISLAFRDTMRAAGFTCGLAMYDSGYAALAGGWNRQGIFSNDSVGFGHWLYLELSDKLRKDPEEWRNFISAADRALELTGRKISQQENRAFGLVSPRVVRLDSLHRLYFPPARGETYRILSFNPTSRQTDTLDIRVGNWLGVLGSRKEIAGVARIDTVGGDLSGTFQRTPGTKSRTVARIVEEPIRILPKTTALVESDHPDSLPTGDYERSVQEPLQVHRIPLQPLLAATYSEEDNVPETQFEWPGFVEGHTAPQVPVFQIRTENPELEAAGAFPKFLIPIINKSYHTGESEFIGVQMTKVLVSEIARLVTEYQQNEIDVGLLAEQSAGGEYYLRIFPSTLNDHKQNRKAR